LIVKTREGRPIKIEANQSSTSARSQATILSFYDSNRAKEPMYDGKSISWSKLDRQIRQKLSEVNDKKIVLLTTSVISETTLEIIKKLSSKYSNFEHVMYDSVPYDSLLDANLESFGLRVDPKYHFDKSDVIVSFGADFLANWLSQDYSKDYVNGRNPKDGKMSRHFQIETNMSHSGAKPDKRIQIKPSEQAYLISNLYKALIGTDLIDERLVSI
jgi:molybdopterin-containing oxidoreductase family iron-sulfur binding subunit